MSPVKIIIIEIITKTSLEILRIIFYYFVDVFEVHVSGVYFSDVLISPPGGGAELHKVSR